MISYSNTDKLELQQKQSKKVIVSITINFSVVSKLEIFQYFVCHRHTLASLNRSGSTDDPILPLPHTILTMSLLAGMDGNAISPPLSQTPPSICNLIVKCSAWVDAIWWGNDSETVYQCFMLPISVTIFINKRLSGHYLAKERYRIFE